MPSSDAVKQALEFLPRWVPLAHPLLPFAAFLYACAVGWLGLWIVLRPLARARGAHWTERARLYFTSTGSRFLPSAWLYGCMAFVSPWTASELSAVPEAWIDLAWILGMYAAWFLLDRIRHRIATGQRVPSGAGLREFLLTLIVRQPLLILALAVLYSGRHADGALRTGLFVAIGLLYALAAVGAGIWLARILRLTVPAPAALDALARGCALRTGISLRGVDVWPGRWANAFALPWIGRIGVTTRTLELLDESQLESVLLHELGHLNEPWHWRVLRALPALFLLGLLLAAASIDFSAGALVALVLGGGVLHFSVLRFMRRAEERADRHANAHAVADAAYGRALERLYEANLTPAVMPRGHTHPHLYDRMLAARVTPDYPRPDPPSNARTKWFVIGMLITLVAPLIALAKYAEHAALQRSDQPSLYWRAALSLDAAGALADLGQLRSKQQRLPESIAFFRASSAIAPTEPHAAANLAIVLARAGELDGARTALADAEGRMLLLTETDADRDAAYETVLQSARDAIRWAELNSARR
jgi:Zn-dependent protease with chaperone function